MFKDPKPFYLIFEGNLNKENVIYKLYNKGFTRKPYDQKFYVDFKNLSNTNNQGQLMTPTRCNLTRLSFLFSNSFFMIKMSLLTESNYFHQKLRLEIKRFVKVFNGITKKFDCFSIEYEIRKL